MSSTAFCAHTNGSSNRPSLSRVAADIIHRVAEQEVEKSALELGSPADGRIEFA